MESANYESGLSTGEAMWLDDVRALGHLYKKFHEDLLIYAFFIVQDPEIAWQVVKTLFDRIWDNRHLFDIGSIEYKYLLVEIRKLCLPAGKQDR